MKQLLIMLFVAFSFAACTTKETKETTHTETIVEDDNDAPVVVEDDNKVEINVSDTGAGMKIKVP